LKSPGSEKKERHPVWEILDGLQMDLRASNAKIVELRARLSQMDGLPEGLPRINGPVTAPACPGCGCNGAHAADCEDA